jgi:hypothetical protein
MRSTTFVRLLGIMALAACDSGLEPEPAALGSTLDPDGAPALIAGLGVASSATGSGIISGNASLRAMTFSALAAPDGTVRGQYTVVLNGNERRLAGTRGKLMGEVTCLRVVGNRAFIAGDTKKDDLEALPVPIGGVAIEVVDGGEGPGAVDEVSTIGLYLDLANANAWCEAAEAGPTFQAEHGQVQVR